MPPAKKYRIEPPYYPIVYVRGYAMMKEEREETFYDAYYGFAATSVEKRQVPPPDYFLADLFEGQLIRFMKTKEFGYADATNEGLVDFDGNPSRSIWVCRFYDPDVFHSKVRSIEEHAEDLRKMVCDTIPAELEENGVDLGPNRSKYKIILLAHSMGGLVCRTLIQNLLPEKKEDPKRWIHRLVTMGTPHRGIDLGRIPNIIEDPLTTLLNPFDAAIFKEPRMREYLKLPKNCEVHSLGPVDARSFSVKRCFCLIGSDYSSYNVVRQVTGNHSDGLVKQDHAYLVAGPRPPKDQDYPDDRVCFWANVHRAHSGRRGIVNSYESFENIQRFLFGNIKAEIALENLAFTSPPEKGMSYFYDFEFLFSIRKTGVYLHQRQQNPCENAFRVMRDKMPASLPLHTAFLNSKMKDRGQKFSHFNLKLRVVEHRVKEGFLWDHEYPERPIYNETVEIRIGDTNPQEPGDEVQYRWLSDGDAWHDVEADDADVFPIPLRPAGTFNATLAVKAGKWPDPALTLD